jgi:hypothetical protein
MLGRFMDMLVGRLGQTGAIIILGLLTIGFFALLAAGTDGESLGRTIVWLLQLAQ